MGKHEYRDRNPNWRGGKSVASNGYVLVRVGVDHHLADVRGYAYEHRLVAEQMLGRRLLPGEQVHHIDGDRQNNDPRNLDVKSSQAEHQVSHRKRADLRLPSEPNTRIVCGCGCGIAFDKFDGFGRPRAFLPGHNNGKAEAAVAVKNALESGPTSLQEIAAVAELPVFKVRRTARRMIEAGAIEEGRLTDNRRPKRVVKHRHVRLTVIVNCACGCGAELTARDKSGRVRFYVSGHNGRKVAA